MRILAVGDIHLGARPSRLPSEFRDRSGQYGPSQAWRRTVETAIDRRVQAVVLAGDVVDNDDDFFEGYRELSREVERLRSHGIRVFGVAGNHDVLVLPRLAAEVPDFRLLGAGGQWECLQVEHSGQTAHIWGWSFPEAKVTSSPLRGANLDRRSGVNIGFLHCDLDQSGSPYAPVASGELEATDFDAWFLGHIHKPGTLTADRPFGYLGSLTGTDPGEPGVHGPWLISIEGNRIVGCDQIPLAPMQWRSLEVDLTGLEDPNDVSSRLIAAIRVLDQEISADSPEPDLVGLRVALVGRSRYGSASKKVLADTAADGQTIEVGGSVQYFVEKIQVRNTPEVHLEELAQRSDPAGLLAARILVLDRGADDPDRRELIARAASQLAGVQDQQRFSGIETQNLDDATVTKILRNAGMQLLEQMQIQVGDAL